MASDRVVVVDGTALAYRAFFALPRTLRTTWGLPTNAVYGFATMFRKILAGKRPARGAVVFDAPGGTFRDAAYPAYKANRPRMPPDLASQLPWVERVAEVHGFVVLRVPDVEADDVIGTLTRLAVEAGDEVHIVSGDKDFCQLVSKRVRMVDPMRDVTYDQELVRRKWGVPPERFVDFLALVGDTADNIPGVAGVGRKGAAALLERFGSLDGIYANLDALTPRRRAALEAGRTQAQLSRDLATIRTEVALDVTLDDLDVAPVDVVERNALFRELEFFSLLTGDAGTVEATEALDVGVLRTPSEASAWIEGVDGTVGVAVVWEGPSAVRGALVGIALATGAGQARYVPVAGRGFEVLHALRPWLADPAASKVIWGLRDALSILARNDLDLDGVVADTGLASFLLDPAAALPHRHDQVVRRFLRRPCVGLEAVTGSGRGRRALVDIPPGEIAPVACRLAAETLEVWPVLERLLVETGQIDHYERRELPLCRVLADMQVRGVRVRCDTLRGLQVEFSARRAAVEREIHELAGRPFNPGSTKQLSAVLFDELGMPVIKRTKTGYSTDAEVMERLAVDHPIAGAVLRWRALAKLVNTYTQVLLDAVDDDGRVRATFTQTVGVSGRLIATEPDLQRTPIRTSDGRRIREAFVAKPGWRIVSADWSQIELRLLAHITRDPALVSAFSEGADVHRRTAARIFDVPETEVTADQRRVGKTVNFATIYGQGAGALAQRIGVSRAEARQIIDRYFERYRGVKAWIADAIASARQRGYCETLLGRRRYIAELASRDPTTRSYGERIATNTPIQGSAADLCKLAMLRIDEALWREGLRARMVLQIHDELVFEVPPDEVEVVVGLVRRHMEQVWPLVVPLEVDVGVGDSWAEAH